jgi:hypothetical protein
MSLTLFLHIGAAKTGSTFIQNCLQDQRNYLHEHGCYFPLANKREESRIESALFSGGNGMGLASFLSCKAAIKADGHEDKRLKDIFKEARAEGSDLIFSSEFLQFPDPLRLPFLLKLAEYYGYKIKIIYFVRPSLDFAVSGYLQKLKRGLGPGGVPRRKLRAEAGDKDTLKNLSLVEYLDVAIVPFQTTIKLWLSCVEASDFILINYENVKRDPFLAILDIIAPNRIPKSSSLVPKTKLVNRSFCPEEYEAFSLFFDCIENVRLDKLSAALQRVAREIMLLPRPREASPAFSIPIETIGSFCLNNASVSQWISSQFNLKEPLPLISRGCPVSPSTNLNSRLVEKTRKRIFEHLNND